MINAARAEGNSTLAISSARPLRAAGGSRNVTVYVGLAAAESSSRTTSILLPSRSSSGPRQYIPSLAEENGRTPRIKLTQNVAVVCAVWIRAQFVFRMVVTLPVGMLRLHRPDQRRVHDFDLIAAQFINTLVAAPEEVVLHRVTAKRVRGPVLGGYEKRVEERRVVVAMVYGAIVGLDVSAAEMLQAVNVVRMPVAQVLDFPMVGLDFPEHLLLVLAILKETHRRPARLRPRFDNAGDLDGEFASMLLECPDDASAGFILVEPVTFIKNRL